MAVLAGKKAVSLELTFRNKSGHIPFEYMPAFNLSILSSPIIALH